MKIPNGPGGLSAWDRLALSVVPGIYAGLAGMAQLDGAGWLCWMGRAVFAGCVGWRCRMGRSAFAEWTGQALADGPGWHCRMCQNVVSGCARLSDGLSDGPDWLCQTGRVALPDMPDLCCWMGSAGFVGWARVGFAGWAGLTLLNKPEWLLPNGPGWLCRMGWAGVARWAVLALLDVSGGFAGWAG